MIIVDRDYRDKSLRWSATGGSSAVNQVGIAQAILQHFNGNAVSSPLISPRSHTVILWVVDGFGMNLWQAALSRGIMSDKFARKLPGRSVFPTTTAAGLASLAFAAPPAVHGALGFSVYIKALDQRVNLLSGKDERGLPVAPEVLYVPQPTIFNRLLGLGIRSAVMSPETYRASGFSQWIYRGAEYYGYDFDRPRDVVDLVMSSLEAGSRFVWIYWPYVDQTAHAKGPTAPETFEALALWDTVQGLLMERVRKREAVTIMVTADHGMTSLEIDKAIPRSDPRAASVWAKPWAGERRAITTQMTAHAVNDLFGAAVRPYAQADLWDRGWYGGPPANPEWRSRVLETLILTPSAVQFEQDGRDDEPLLRGGHGGTTVDEEAIPILITSW